MSNKDSLDLVRIPKELKLILEIIRLENGEILQLKNVEWITHINWSLFLKLANHHRLYPLLFSKIKIIEQKIIPLGVVQTIFQKYKKNTFEMLHLSAEMEQVSKRFAENGIRLLVLKGPVLATDLYGDLSLRTCRDLDFLVSINDMEKVDELLLKQGYKKDESFQIETVLNDWKWRHHHIAYYHPYKRVKLEIHWRLNPGPGKEPTFQELWDRKRISSHTNQSVYYLGREDLFFFLITHGARHGWSRLRWLVDINRILRQKMDWNKAIKLLKDHQSLHIGGQALLLSSELLKTPFPNEMMQFAKDKHANRLAQSTLFYLEKMVNLHSEPLPEYITKYHDRYLFLLKSSQQKLLYIISIFYPSITDVNTFRLPKFLYFLYFPLRPVFLVLRKTKKQSLSLKTEK
nr:nucleotidyltransferase family protein [Neobacillus sp. Marseille-Q6967]